MQQLTISPVKNKEYIEYLEKQISSYISVNDLMHLKSVLKIPENIFSYTGIEITEESNADETKKRQEDHKKFIQKMSQRLFTGDDDEPHSRIIECEKMLYETLCIEGTKAFNAKLDQIIGNYITDNLKEILYAIPNIIEKASRTLALKEEIPQTLEFLLRELAKGKSNTVAKNSIKEAYEALIGIY